MPSNVTRGFLERPYNDNRLKHRMGDRLSLAFEISERFQSARSTRCHLDSHIDEDVGGNVQLNMSNSLIAIAITRHTPLTPSPLGNADLLSQCSTTQGAPHVLQVIQAYLLSNLPTSRQTETWQHDLSNRSQCPQRNTVGRWRPANAVQIQSTHSSAFTGLDVYPI